MNPCYQGSLGISESESDEDEDEDEDEKVGPQEADIKPNQSSLTTSPTPPVSSFLDVIHSSLN